MNRLTAHSIELARGDPTSEARRTLWWPAMIPAAPMTRARSRLGAALVAAGVLASCVAAYVALPTPAAVHHAQWSSAGRVEAQSVTLPLAPAGALPTALQAPPLVSAILRAAPFDTPAHPDRRPPGLARAPPALPGRSA